MVPDRLLLLRKIRDVKHETPTLRHTRTLCWIAVELLHFLVSPEPTDLSASLAIVQVSMGRCIAMKVKAHSSLEHVELTFLLIFACEIRMLNVEQWSHQDELTIRNTVDFDDR